MTEFSSHSPKLGWRMIRFEVDLRQPFILNRSITPPIPLRPETSGLQLVECWNQNRVRELSWSVERTAMFLLTLVFRERKCFGVKGEGSQYQRIVSILGFSGFQGHDLGEGQLLDSKMHPSFTVGASHSALCHAASVQECVRMVPDIQ